MQYDEGAWSLCGESNICVSISSIGVCVGLGRRLGDIIGEMDSSGAGVLALPFDIMAVIIISIMQTTITIKYFL